MSYRPAKLTAKALTEHFCAIRSDFPFIVITAKVESGLTVYSLVLDSNVYYIKDSEMRVLKGSPVFDKECDYYMHTKLVASSFTLEEQDIYILTSLLLSKFNITNIKQALPMLLSKVKADKLLGVI